MSKNQNQAQDALTTLFENYNNSSVEKITELIEENFVLDGDKGEEDEEGETKYFLFLTSNGHYQHRFISLYEPLHNTKLASYFGHLMMSKYFQTKSDALPYFDSIVCVTVSAQLLGAAIRDICLKNNSPFSLVKETNNEKDILLIRLANYYSFQTEKEFYNLKDIKTETENVLRNKKILLVTDVISTGSLVKKFISEFENESSNIVAVFSIADSRVEFEDFTKSNIKNHTWDEEEISVFPERSNPDICFITLCDSIKIFKPKYKFLPNEDLWGIKKNYSTETKHINPILNSIVELKQEYGESKYLLFDDSRSFLELIGDKYHNIQHTAINITHNAYNIDFKNFYKQLSDKNNVDFDKVKNFLTEIYSRLKEKEIEMQKKNWSDKASTRFNDILKYLNEHTSQGSNDQKKQINELTECVKEIQLEVLKQKPTNKSILKFEINQLQSYLDSFELNTEEYRRQVDELRELFFETKAKLAFSPDIIFYPVFSAAEELMRHKEIVSEIFECDMDYIFPLQRYFTNIGWRFAFPPKIYNHYVRHKTILIVDSGSITGESLIQMIDAISVYEPAKVVFLSILGRIEDFNREFFSRIREIKVKHFFTPKELDYLKEKNWNESFSQSKSKNDIRKMLPEDIIPIHIYFGTNIHQFAYQSKEFCPFCNELNQIELTSKENCEAYSLDFFAERKRDLAYDMSNTKFPWPSYLPTIRESSLVQKENTHPPFLEIFEVRDLLGKLSGYRFYPEYYTSINTYFKDDFEDNSKPFELLFSVLIHESRLIKFCKDLMPNIYFRLKDSLFKIITTPSKLDTLYYKWNKFPINYLYVSLLKEEGFFLSNITDFLLQLEFSSDDLSSINYLFHILDLNLEEKTLIISNIIQNINDTIVTKSNAKISSNTNIYRHLKSLIKKIKLLEAKDKITAVFNLSKFYFIDTIQQNHLEYYSKFNTAAKVANDKYNENALIEAKNIVRFWREYYMPNIYLLNKNSIKDVKDRYPSIFGSRNSIITDFTKIEEILEVIEKSSNDIPQNRKHVWLLINTFSKKYYLRGSISPDKFVNPPPPDVKDFIFSLRLKIPNVFLNQLNLILESEDKLDSKLELVREHTWDKAYLETLLTSPEDIYFFKPDIERLFIDIITNKRHFEKGIIKFSLRELPEFSEFTISQNKGFKGSEIEKKALELKLNKILIDYRGSILISNASNECNFIIKFYKN